MTALVGLGAGVWVDPRTVTAITTVPETIAREKWRVWLYIKGRGCCGWGYDNPDDAEAFADQIATKVNRALEPTP